MNEMEPRETEIDSLLRRSMAAPVPSLSPGFDRRVVEEVARRSQAFDGYRRVLLVGYGLTSVVASALAMHGQGLDWGPTWLTIFGALALVAPVRWANRATHTAF
ncbi:hypothetical protein BH11ARM2_BH11ARM2_07040 [soil metagenome]